MLASLRERCARSRKWVARGGVAVVASIGVAVVLAPVSAGATARPGGPAAPAANPYFSVAQNYTIRYYPRFMTYFQQSFSGVNRLAGPSRVGPLYGFVVSINVDTLYASAYLDLSAGPQILTIPKTGVTYSLLTLDVFGDVFKTSIQPQTPGKYGLVPPGCHQGSPRWRCPTPSPPGSSGPTSTTPPTRTSKTRHPRSVPT